VRSWTRWTRHDLLQRRGPRGGDDRDAADLLVGGDLAHRQAFDVVAARGEQAGDPGEDARLVVDDHRERMALGFFFPDVHLAIPAGAGISLE